MSKSVIRSVLVAICLACTIVACNKQPPAFRSTALEGVKWGRDFELTTHSGQRLRTTDYRGKILILFFGYTHCPDICAPTLARLAQLAKALGEDANRIQVFFISVDPKNDSPAQLKKFVSGFDPKFIGLTGTPEELNTVAIEHKVFFKSANTGRVDHSGMLFVKDAKGNLRLLIRESTPLNDMLHDLHLLLAGKRPVASS